MKKRDFISLAIIVIGLWAIYEAIIYSISVILAVVIFVADDFRFDSNNQYFLVRLFYFAIYSGIAWLALKRNSQVISYLRIAPEEAESNFPEEIGTPAAVNTIQKNDVLLVVIIGVALSMLVPALGDFTETFVNYFQARVAPTFENSGQYSLTIPFIKLAFPLVLLVMAKRITTKFFPEK